MKKTHDLGGIGRFFERYNLGRHNLFGQTDVNHTFVLVVFFLGKDVIRGKFGPKELCFSYYFQVN